MESSIIFEISTTNEFLANLLEEALDSAVSGEPLEVNSVEVQLSRVGEAEITPEGKKVDISLPLKIHLKRPAGLFTVEGTGAINLHLSVEFDITEGLMLKAKSDLVDHEWIEKPVLEIGALNIPVETLVNLVLKHHESIITAKIDSSLMQYRDLNTLIQMGLKDVRQKISEIDLKGNRINLDIDELLLREPQIQSGIVTLSGVVRPDISINDSAVMMSSKVPFRWMTDADMREAYDIFIPITFDYDFLESELRNVLQGMEVGGRHFDVQSIRITGGDQLNIELVIDEPIKAQVFINGRPVYDEARGELRLEDLDVKVNPANFIYKLTAPLVNKFIEGKMNDFFPLSVNNQLSKLISDNIPKSIQLEKARIGIAQEGVEIHDLKFLPRKLTAMARIKQLAVASVLG